MDKERLLISGIWVEVGFVGRLGGLGGKRKEGRFGLVGHYVRLIAKWSRGGRGFCAVLEVYTVTTQRRPMIFSLAEAGG